MYRKKDDLPLLVNSLTKGEKRHFTNFYRQAKGNTAPWFLQLYEMYENGESQIRKDFFDSSNRALISAKRLLYTNILKSLRSLHENSSVDTTLQSQLSEIEILFNHNLPDQASLLLNKAYETAAEYEKFGHLLQILEWEKRLNIILDEVSRPTMEIINEENLVLQKTQQLKNLESLYSHIMLMKKKYGYVNGDLKTTLTAETIASPQMPAEVECLSEKACYYRNFIFSIYHWMVFEPREAFTYSKQLLIEKDHSILPGDFILGVFQHITSSVCLGLFDDTLNGLMIAQTYFEQYRLDQSAKFRSLMFVYKSTYEIKALLFKGDLRRLKRIVQATQQGLHVFEKILPGDHLQIVKGNLMNGYMALGNWKQADRLWNELFQIPARNIRRDILADLYLFRIFNLLHSKYYDQVPAALNKSIRFFKSYVKDGHQLDVELGIAYLLQKEKNYGSAGDRKALLESAKKIIRQFISAHPGAGNFQEHYSRYEIWCDAIIRDEPFYKAAAKWHRTFNASSPRAFVELML